MDEIGRWSFLGKIGNQLKVRQGKNETKDGYVSRIIFSAVSRIFLTALWDRLDKDREVSITHVKRRTRQQWEIFKKLFPEVLTDECDVYGITDAMYDTYQQNGFFYHHKGYIIPAMNKRCLTRNLCLLRGSYLDEPVIMSGMGLFQKESRMVDSWNEVAEVFQLPSRNILEAWDQSLQTARWKEMNLTGKISFARVKGNFYYGYWQNKPDQSEDASLLKVEASASIYYLYRFVGRNMQVAELPLWRTSKGSIYTLLNGLLKKRGALPEIHYLVRQEIVEINLGYLLPPRELAFYKLYSWHGEIKQVKNDFHRIMQVDFFLAFKKIMESKGYVFKEGLL